MTAINPRTCVGFLELAANAVKVTETHAGSGEKSVFVERVVRPECHGDRNAAGFVCNRLQIRFCIITNTHSKL